MPYRGLSSEQMSVVKDATKKVCEANGLKAIGDFNRVGNGIIDELENGSLGFEDLLHPVINYTPPPEEKGE